MKTRDCRPMKTRAGDNAPRPAARARRGGEIAGWIVPSEWERKRAASEVAAYVALATGLGISLPTATHLRTMLVVLCVASLVFIGARRVWRHVARAIGLH